MEPGEGSAAPKATVALPGTDVNPAGRAPARLAVHCNLATGGPGAATPHAPFGRPRRPLGTFPRGESTSSARRRTKPLTKNRFLVEGRGKTLLAFPCFAEGFASAEATKGLSDRPLETFGAHACGRFCGPRKRKTFLLRFSLERQTRPGSARNRGAPDCQKTFGRCRRGRSPSDFHSCKPALPASRVVDFACKINSLQIRATSG